ncbi:uncharacterized protein LOC124938541 isoform X2 [Impatiens glandulifera]|uniref:uncharacterized protein LOC124938541 isoform X2 n=1 Tax=Impatiens glandulifera TaxID=253017 RepID=UPI001FB14FB9|nr:uncharacterized protein LOC124938541 isoform X2 [Impatiens glandulifera]
MASFQILKSNLSPSSFSQSDSHNPHLVRKQFLGYQANNKRASRRLRIFCTHQESDKQNNEPPESLFMKELKRRGMNSSSLFEESNKTSYGDEELKFREEDGNYFKQNVMSTDYGRNLSNQREQSMALNSEGLEGLIPRAKVLLSIGGTFFLAFGPLIILTVAIFFGLYLYFGTAFIHDASSTPITPPQYIDPYALLEEQRISEMVRRLN